MRAKLSSHFHHFTGPVKVRMDWTPPADQEPSFCAASEN